jgi:hypothetical protein
VADHNPWWPPPGQVRSARSPDGVEELLHGADHAAEDPDRVPEWARHLQAVVGALDLQHIGRQSASQPAVPQPIAFVPNDFAITSGLPPTASSTGAIWPRTQPSTAGSKGVATGTTRLLRRIPQRDSGRP